MPEPTGPNPLLAESRALADSRGLGPSAAALLRILHLMSALDLDADPLFRRVMDCNWQRDRRYSTVRGG